MRTNVFISGPMSGFANYNMNAFMDAHAELKKAGAELVFNPILEWLSEPERVSQRRMHESYMLICLTELTAYEPHPQNADAIMPKYDILVHLDGWQNSPGSKTEVTVAEAVGIQTMDLQAACNLIRTRQIEAIERRPLTRHSPV